MNLYTKLYEEFKEKTKEIKIEKLIIGLSYTAVKLSNNNIGLSFTWADNSIESISHDKNFSPENKPVIDYLDFITDKSPIKKSIGIAIINALNHDFAATLKDDDKNTRLLSNLKIDNNSKVAMVGFIPPMVKRLKEMGVTPDILDHGKKVGNEDQFLSNLKNRDFLIITSSSLLSKTFEKILSSRGDNTKTILIGPTTPMVPKVFKDEKISFLAGSHTLNHFNLDILREVSHGKGTPILKNFSRKIILKL